MFAGAIKLVHGQSTALQSLLQLGSTRIRSGQESLLGVLDTFIVSCSLFLWCIDKLSLRLGERGGLELMS